MKPEDRKRLKQHIEMIVEHKEPTNSQTEKILRDACEEQIKGKLELEDKNRKLRLELNALRFKTSQQERFIWWVREVFAKKVQDTVAGIIEACTYQDEPTAAAGKYGLPIKCFEMMRSLTEYTHGIYDGAYITHQVSTVVKTSTDNNKCWWTQESDPEVFPNLWRTGCGNSFYLDAEKPSDNHMKYCCYCGKEIAEGE